MRFFISSSSKLLGGHDNRSASALSSGFKYDVSKATWSSSDVPEMQDARKDHACLYIELETTKGILVTGGKYLERLNDKNLKTYIYFIFIHCHTSVFICNFNVTGLGENGLVLDSAEFLDLKTKKWTKTSSLKVGRTEHVMSLVYGIPTVIGGRCFKLINVTFILN